MRRAAMAMCRAVPVMTNLECQSPDGHENEHSHEVVALWPCVCNEQGNTK